MNNTNTTPQPKANTKAVQTTLETYFSYFRSGIIGTDQEFESVHGKQKIIYADWTASGRLYQPIEEKLVQLVGPFMANTHTKTTVTAAAMSSAYQQARQMIKKHVNAAPEDILITEGTGMTGVINKFQRILGLKINENLKKYTNIPQEMRPLVLVSHMEHHSNHTSWLETIAKVMLIPANEEGLPSIESLEELLKKYQHIPTKIAAITACSNVTGITTNYHKIAGIMHKNGGYCFVDFACSAPYMTIDMHPKKKEEYLDAISFSPHKFLGGPGTTGVLIFNKKLYKNQIPDHPGGGTVSYTNPWGDRTYIDDIETREDGGTPGLLQTIKTALVIKLKEQMGVSNILAREKELKAIVWDKLSKIEKLHILAKNNTERLGIFSFYVEDVHYDLIVQLLNDRFGIQTRGGCSCAGTYGHYLLNINPTLSKSIAEEIAKGGIINRPGWVRMSIHPTMTNAEVLFICEAIAKIVQNIEHWKKEYQYNGLTNEYAPKTKSNSEYKHIENWFQL